VFFSRKGCGQPAVPLQSSVACNSESAMIHQTSRARRRLLSFGAVALAAPMLALSRKSLASTGPRSLSFENLHTGETLSLVYAVGDQYVQAALQNVRQFL